MIAVLDASPLCYLLLIGEIDLLPQLFSRVVVPRTVILELQHDDVPATVRNWASNLPIWLFVEETPDTFFEGLEKLQAGERVAIFLAELTQADTVIIDEKAAGLIAGRRGLAVTGVIGVLGEAATRGLVVLTLAIDRLRRINFRCSPALFKATLEQYRKPSA